MSCLHVDRKRRALHPHTHTLTHPHTLLLAVALGLLSSGARAAGIAASDLPKDAVLQNPSLLLRFRADAEGLRLTSLMNQLTRREYLHPGYSPAEAEGLPQPSLWEGRAPGNAGPPKTLPEGSGSADASRVGNPFYVIAQRGGKSEVFQAGSDFDVTSWSANDQSLNVTLRGRSIFLEATLRVTMAPECAYWRLSLRNLSSEAMTLTVGLPAFARLVIDGPRRDTVAVPWGSGAILRDPATLHWHGDYGAELSAPVVLWQGEKEGLYLSDNNRVDSGGSSDSYLRRSVQVGPDENLPPDSGPSLAMRHTFRLEKNGTVDLGPVMLGMYRGDSMAGAASLAQARRYNLHVSRSAALEKEPFIARQEGKLSPFTEGPLKQGWKVVMLSGFAGPTVGNYIAVSPEMGGLGGLKKSIQELHLAGGRVLLTLDGGHVAKDSAIGKAEGFRWVAKDTNGKRIEENGLWVMCPANAQWRAWLGDVVVRLLRVTGADGIAISGLAGEPYHLCSSVDHGHASPYIWSWGVRRFFADLRDRLDRDFPNTPLVCVGALDSVREYVDAFVADTHAQTGYRFEFPLLRTLYPDLRVYESASAADPSLSGRLRAWNVSQGMPLYEPHPLAEGAVPPPRPLYEAFSNVLNAAYVAAPVTTSSRDVSARLLVEGAYILAVGNLGDEPFTGQIRVPYRVGALEDPRTGLRLEPEGPGLFSIALLPRQGNFWRIVPPGAGSGKVSELPPKLETDPAAVEPPTSKGTARAQD